MKSKPVFLYVTAPSEQEAEKICVILLQKKLAACVNYFPNKSQYLWKGKLEKRNEWILIIKTIEQKISLLEKEMKRIHPYNIPCITKIHVKVNAEYASWLTKEVALIQISEEDRD